MNTETLSPAEALNAVNDPQLLAMVKDTQALIARRRDLDRIDAERDANKARCGYWLSNAELNAALQLLSQFDLWSEIPFEEPQADAQLTEAQADSAAAVVAYCEDFTGRVGGFDWNDAVDALVANDWNAPAAASDLLN